MKRVGMRSAAAGAVSLVLVLGSCSREAEVAPSAGAMPPDALATIDGKAITMDSAAQRLRGRSSRRSRPTATLEQREALLEELIRFEVLAANARKAGYDEDPEILAAVERLMVKRFQQDQLQARLDAIEIGDAEIEAHYAAHQAEYTIPETRRVGVIFLRLPVGVTDARRGELVARAEEARSAVAEGGEPFARVATRYSEDTATRYRGGDAGWLSREDPSSHWEPAVVEAAFALAEPGELTPVVVGQRGLYVVRLTERRDGGTRPLAKVRDSIRYQLLRERRASLESDFYADMRSNVKVEVNEALLESLLEAQVAEVRPAAQTPPPLPTGRVQ